MSEIKLFNNEEFGNVRVATNGNNVMFCLSDVCRVLEIANPRNVKSRLPEKGVCIMDILTNGGKQPATFINEPNLYRVIFQSRKDSAEKFQEWVFEEVIPQIRRTGKYEAKESYMIEDPAERAIRWAEEYRERKALEEKVKVLEPKAQVFDQIIDSKMLVNLRDAAKQLDVSQSQFIGWLLDKRFVYKDNQGIVKPYEQYVEYGLFKIRTYINSYRNHTGVQTMLTPRGVATFEFLMERSGKNRKNLKKYGGRKRHA